MALHIRLLGEPCLERDGERVAGPRGNKAWALLAYLLLVRRPPGRRQLAELLFCEAEDPLGALRWSLAQLRQALAQPAALRGDPLDVALADDTVVDLWQLGARGRPEGRQDIERGVPAAHHPRRVHPDGDTGGSAVAAAPAVADDQRRAVPPGPAAGAAQRHLRDHNEIKALGERTSTTRSAEQTAIARFWEYTLPPIYHGSCDRWRRRPAAAVGTVLKAEIGAGAAPTLTTSSPAANGAVRTWKTVDAFVAEVASARSYAGVPYRTSTEAGAAMSRPIGGPAVARFRWPDPACRLRVTAPPRAPADLPARAG